jgi:undecaprenyl-diphosphatase
MTILEACLLGTIQGITEFLPISSTAHLLATRQLMGHPHPEDAFTTVVQLGSLVAVFLYFRTDLANLASGLWRDFKARRPASNPESRLLWYIALGTVPVVVVGLLGKNLIRSKFYDCQSIGIVAIAFALVMLAAEVWHKHRRVKLGRSEGDIPSIDLKIALWMGLWQMLALLPGASRSGCTISGGLFAGLARSTAARFSFLLALPSILGAGLKDLYDEYKLFKDPSRAERPSLFAAQEDVTALIVGTAVSAVVSYLAIAWLMNFLKRYDMTVFVVYRILLGIVLLMLVLYGLVK